jgi:hypothetical protein
MQNLTTMKKTIFTLFIFILGLTLFNSCRECPKEKFKGDFTFSESEAKILPYEGHETLTFKDSIGDTVCFHGGTRRSIMTQGYHFPEGETECYSEYWNYEETRLSFTGKNGSYIFIYLEKNHEERNFFEIITYVNAPYDFGFTVYSQFSSNNFYCGQEDIAIPLDSIKINNKTFYSVYEIYYDCALGYIPIVYYTINDGIVGFMTLDYKKWNLE